MPLLEATTLAIGTAIAKQMIKVWLGDNLASTAAQAALGPIQQKLADMLGQRREGDQIEAVAQRVVTNMQLFFYAEARDLVDATRTAVVLEAAETLSSAKIDARLLIAHRLDPNALGDALIDGRPQATELLSVDAAAIYERLLRETSRNIIYIANNVDGYEPAYGHAVLFDLQHILENLERVLSMHDRDAADYEQRYCDALRQRLNQFEQFGIDYADQDGKTQPLDVAYVPLSAEDIAVRDRDGDVEPGFEIEGFSQRAGRLNRGRPAPTRLTGAIDAILPLSRRFIIRGQPGSGKSTLLRWLAIHATQGDFSDFNPDLADWNDCVPFFIQLRSTVDKCFPSPKAWPTLHVTTLAVDPPPRWVHDLLVNGRALVLIDGVDELPVAQRAAMLEDLQALLHNYPYARYIITSRPAAVKAWDEWLIWKEGERFATLSLRDMQLEQMMTFVDQWYAALLDTIGKEEEEERTALTAMPGGLKQLLRQQLPLRRLARSPLLCAMICALYRRKPNSLPNDRVTLYGDCIRMLLFDRDRDRSIGSVRDYPALGLPHMEALLQEYADHLMENDLSEEANGDVEQFFDEQLPFMALPDWTGEKLRHYFVARTGLLTEIGDDVTAFRHRTFQEYLAAKVIVRKNNIPMLLKHARDDQWRETILLAAGLPETDRKKCDRLVNGLLAHGDRLKTERYQQELYLLAVACLETAIMLDPAIRRRVLDKASALIPPQSDDVVALVAKASDPAVPLLQIDPKHSVDEMERCIDALAQIGSDAAMDAIADYAQSEYHNRRDEYVNSVQEAVGSAWFRFDLERYRDRILSNVEVLYLNSTQLRDADLSYLSDLARLQWLSLASTPVSDDGLSHLSELHCLQRLQLAMTQVSDAGLAHLSGLGSLQVLMLYNTQVSDAGLFHLSELGSLQRLGLSSTQVSDAGLSHLSGLRSLRELDLSSTQVSDAGLAHLSGLRSLQ